MRLIDADALLERMKRTNRYFDVKFDIEEAPTIDAVPVVHSSWILHKDGSGTCRNCRRRQNEIWDMDTWQRYCGDCGAKMDLEG